MDTTLIPQQIAVERAKLTVWTAGSGPAVLLVHGFPDDHSVWRHQVPALVQAGCRVVVPDMRGCGESSMPRRVSDYRLAYQIEDLQTVITALGLDEVHLVGHDLGATSARQSPRGRALGAPSQGTGAPDRRHQLLPRQHRAADAAPRLSAGHHAGHGGLE